MDDLPSPKSNPRQAASVSGIGSHTAPNNGAFDTWLTPQSIVRALGSFDLDPCAAPSPRPWPTAESHFEKADGDGLDIGWAGRVWLNPPYGKDIGKWMQRMSEHGEGIALIFARTETEAWQKWVWPYAAAVLFVAGRLHFCLPDGTATKMNAGGPSALIAYSPADRAALEKSGIRGCLVTRVVCR